MTSLVFGVPRAVDLQDLLLAVQHLGYFALTPEAGNIAGDR